MVKEYDDPISREEQKRTEAIRPAMTVREERDSLQMEQIRSHNQIENVDCGSKTGHLVHN